MLQFGGVGPTALPTLQNDRLQNSSELPVSLPLPGCTSSAYSSADLNGFVYPQGNACPDRRIGGTIDEHHDEAVKSLTDLARSELRNSTERPNASHDKIFTVTSVNNIPFDSVNVILGIPIVSRENYLGIAAFSMSNKSALKLVSKFRFINKSEPCSLLIINTSYFYIF